jgi:preprotein translocase subunit SecD
MRFCLSIMKVYTPRFNLFLALAVLLVPLSGCSSLGLSSNQPVAALRVHVELAPENVGEINASQTVSVLRADPVQVTIEKDVVLSEQDVIAATLINTPDAPAIEVRFDETGTWVLEQYSAANPGRHFVIFAQWGKNLKNARWIAAPFIAHRINDGILSFTPDMSKDEASEFVKDLNSTAKQLQTGS